MFYLLVFFIVIPFVELTLLLYLADYIGAAWTLGTIVFTGILGASLARWQGWRTYQRIQNELQNQRMPTDSLADAGMILVAGALLLTPGILTDLFGFSLLAPVCRRFYRGVIMNWIRNHLKIQTTFQYGHASHHGGSGHVSPDENVVDGHVVRPDAGNPSVIEKRDAP